MGHVFEEPFACTTTYLIKTTRILWPCGDDRVNGVCVADYSKNPRIRT